MKNSIKPLKEFPLAVQLDIISMMQKNSAFERKETMLSFMLPIEVVSEANRHEVWQVKSQRVKGQRIAVAQSVGEILKDRGKPHTVSLCRLAARKLDAAENLPMSFKAVKDELCSILGFDDRDESVRWNYSQEKPADKIYGIMILIDWNKPKCCPTCGQVIPS